MPVRFNHTILPARDAGVTAAHTAEILGLSPVRRAGPFHVIDIADEASIDYVSVPDGADFGHHLAFLVDDETFDAILQRVRDRGLIYWADPRMDGVREINHLHGGRGFYFDDLDGNHLEVITAPYAKA